MIATAIATPANRHHQLSNCRSPPQGSHHGEFKLTGRGYYRAKVANLQQALADNDDHAALEAARALIEKVTVSPPKGDDELPGIELIGDLAEILRAAGLGGASQDGATRAVDVLNVFASSVKEGPGQSPGQGYRISVFANCARRRVRKASSHPALLILPFIEPLEPSSLARLSAMRRNKAMF